ncbi:MAG: hypothetical protein ACP5QR_06390 [Rhizomicrobium sp.]
MSDLPWLSEVQMLRIEPYFPLSPGVPRVDDPKITNDIIFAIGTGLRRCTAVESTARFRRWHI